MGGWSISGQNNLLNQEKNIQHWTSLDQDIKYLKVNAAVLKMVMLMLKMKIMVEMTPTATLYEGDAVVYVEDDC